jgi:3-hexulose-6-phosphate synthase / 6-phospho-3-hexuloisomerase
MEVGTIQRLSKEIVEGFKGLCTSTIGNVLDDMNIQGVIPNIKPVQQGFSCVGSAVTVKQATGVLHSYTNADFKLGQVVDSTQAGDVLVIDNAGHQVSTWGGIASGAAKNYGLSGLVVDGGVRDLEEIVDVGFPVFSRHVVPISGKGRIKITNMNTVVKIDGVMVSPGDVIVADGTGIVCVPAGIAAEVLKMAWEFERQDNMALEEVKKGLSLGEALKKFAKM